MTQEEIKDLCESWGVNPEGAELFNEDYIISKTGDLICGTNFSYCIYDGDLKKPDWIPHLRQKNWYKDKTFIPAYIEALRRKGIYSASINVTENRFVTIFPYSVNPSLLSVFCSIITELYRENKQLEFELMNKKP